MYAFSRSKVGTSRCRQHQSFAQEQWMIDKHGAEDNTEKEDVGETLKSPFFVSRFLFADFAWRTRKINSIHQVKHDEQDSDSYAPSRQAMLRHPPEGDAVEIAEEQ